MPWRGHRLDRLREKPHTVQKSRKERASFAAKTIPNRSTPRDRRSRPTILFAKSGRSVTTGYALFCALLKADARNIRSARANFK
jgi:hypothetical protein